MLGCRSLAYIPLLRLLPIEALSLSQYDRQSLVGSATSLKVEILKLTFPGDVSSPWSGNIHPFCAAQARKKERKERVGGGDCIGCRTSSSDWINVTSVSETGLLNRLEIFAERQLVSERPDTSDASLCMFLAH